MIVYAAYKNADMTEGRGPYVIDKIFSEKEFAEDYIDTQPGVMGIKGQWSKESNNGHWIVREHGIIDKNIIDKQKLEQEKIIQALDKLTLEERKLLGLED